VPRGGSPKAAAAGAAAGRHKQSALRRAQGRELVERQPHSPAGLFDQYAQLQKLSLDCCDLRAGQLGIR